MSVIGNILWFIFAGLWQGIGWGLVGIIWCITIIGIPVGKQCFKMAGLSFFPFGKEVEYSDSTFSFLVNILWIIFGGLGLAFGTFMNGVVLCITIVGIPFGIQCFKQAKLALMPFGAEIKPKDEN